MKDSIIKTTVYITLLAFATSLLGQTTNLPVVGIPCYVNGDPNQTSFTVSDAFIMVNYDPNAVAGSELGTAADIIVLGRDEEIGATWGVAYNSNTGNFYASSVLKRHIGYPTNGSPGAIYKMSAQDDGNGNRLSAPVLLADLSALGANTGTIGGGALGTNASRGLGSIGGLSQDQAAYDLVGKFGIGDIDISPDKRTLYAVALGNGLGGVPQLVSLDITMENPTSLLRSIDVTAATTGISGATGALRPWGLGVDQTTGDVYLGVVSEGSGDLMPGSGYILKYNESANTFTSVFNFPFNYARTNSGVPSGCDADWEWLDEYLSNYL